MAPQSGARKPTVSTGELSSCHAALTTAECDSASEPAGDERASDSVPSGVGGTNLIPRLRPMVCVYTDDLAARRCGRAHALSHGDDEARHGFAPKPPDS